MFSSDRAAPAYISRTASATGGGGWAGGSAGGVPDCGAGGEPGGVPYCGGTGGGGGGPHPPGGGGGGGAPGGGGPGGGGPGGGGAPAVAVPSRTPRGAEVAARRREEAPGTSGPAGRTAPRRAPGARPWGPGTWGRSWSPACLLPRDRARTAPDRRNARRRSEVE